MLGHSHSEHPISLPTERAEAALYLTRYKGKRFFCGVRLGGCGWELMHKLYGDRVCHFAHHPDPKGIAPECERRYFGADSADHLYIHRGLSTGLGKAERPHRFQGTMVNGQCTDLLVNPGRSRSAVKVQFVNLSHDAWAREDEELRARLGRVDWMLGLQASRTARYLLDRDGYALRVRCEQVGSARLVRVGTETSDGDLEWHALDECELSEQGIVTPLLRKIRRTTVRPVSRTTRSPGFPLAVEKIVILPQEKATRPEDCFPEGSHSAAVDVRIDGGERVRARIVVPHQLDLVIDEPYSLVEPASVDVTGEPPHPVSPWTIFSGGLTPVLPSERRPASPPPPQHSAPAPKTPSKKTVRTPGQSEALARHKLTSLIGEMRQARKSGDHREVIKLLTANHKLLKQASTHRRFRKEQDTINELRRWASAKHKANEQIEQDVRKQSAALIKQIDQAREAGNVAEAQRAIAALRKTLVRVSLNNPKFSDEAESLRARETWLKQAQAELRRAERVRQQETRAEALRSKHRSRLGEVLDLLMKAEIAGRTNEVRRLYSEGQSLLGKLGDHATPHEKHQLSLTAKWLGAAGSVGGNDDESSAAALLTSHEGST